MVRGFEVLEKRNLMEHDSPVPSLVQDLFGEDLSFGYLSSEQAAYSLISVLQKKHQVENTSLELGKNYYHVFGLVGWQSHPFSHELQITHKIGLREIPENKINDNISNLEELVIRRDLHGHLPFHLVKAEILNYGYIGKLRDWCEFSPEISELVELDYHESLLRLSGILELYDCPTDIAEKLTVFSNPDDALKWLTTPLSSLKGKSPENLLWAADYITVNWMLDILHAGGGGT